uniref:Putative mannosyltransferase MNT4 n=1 Tax=Candida albicans TaxID=5476 RepID=Q9P874_CANAX|nr:putative mannosyltransferase MNT4 [Candida albicans]
MISFISLRRRKLISILAIFTIFILSGSIIGYYNGHHHIIKMVENYTPDDFQNSITALTNKFDFSYLPGFKGIITKNNSTSFESLDDLDMNGFSLIPGNVQFKFLNKGNKKGTPEQILEQNMKDYKELLGSKTIGQPKDAKLVPPPPPEELPNYKRANATILSLVRNGELGAIGISIKRLQKKFNSKYNYPYTFLNDEPFTDRFKQRILKYTGNAPVEFVQIKPEYWQKPSFIDTVKEAKEMEIMFKHDVAYAKKQSYHNMCRFYSSQFYKIPELQKYKYYWRVEPKVNFFTDINYDVFKYMEDTQKIYGFTINLYDNEETVKTLWPETIKYLNQGDNYKYINPKGSFQWLLEDLQNPKKTKFAGGYSTCHFWSNFEIGDFDFFRNEAYDNWVKYLDSTGKFYYERWGDAPVHSIGVSLFADKDKIHFFKDIGYDHDPYTNCPNTETTQMCEIGKFSRWEHLYDQNCLMNWLHHDQPKDVY